MVSNFTPMNQVSQQSIKLFELLNGPTHLTTCSHVTLTSMFTTLRPMISTGSTGPSNQVNTTYWCQGGLENGTAKKPGLAHALSPMLSYRVTHHSAFSKVYNCTVTTLSDHEQSSFGTPHLVTFQATSTLFTCWQWHTVHEGLSSSSQSADFLQLLLGTMLRDSESFLYLPALNPPTLSHSTPSMSMLM